MALASGYGGPASVRAVLGIDGDRNRWIGVLLFDGAFASAHRADDLDGLLKVCPQAEVVAIDIPIGWPAGPRRADSLARSRLPGRASSVFNAPAAAVRDAATHAEANELSRRSTGKGLSKQSWALVPKIAEATVLAHRGGRAVVEAHPEVSFAEMAGGVIVPANKRTWAGQRERARRLREAGIELPDDLGAAGEAGADDVLDAAAVAWTADRISRGVAFSLPDPPERDVDGLEMAIWV